MLTDKEVGFECYKYGSANLAHYYVSGGRYAEPYKQCRAAGFMSLEEARKHFDPPAGVAQTPTPEAPKVVLAETGTFVQILDEDTFFDPIKGVTIPVIPAEPVIYKEEVKAYVPISLVDTIGSQILPQEPEVRIHDSSIAGSIVGLPLIVIGAVIVGILLLIGAMRK